MTPAQRCDEIIRMIEEVLDPHASPDGLFARGFTVGSTPAPHFALTHFESPR
jgi:hypothetical protein